MSESRPSLERSSSSDLAFEQVRMLWDDQVDLAGTLREKRKVSASLLVVLIGLGVFRLQLFRRATC